MQQFMISFNSSLYVFVRLLEMLLYSEFLANPSRLLYKETNHELLHHLVALIIPNLAVKALITAALLPNYI
jgi:hypothetical protein